MIDVTFIFIPIIPEFIEIALKTLYEKMPKGVNFRVIVVDQTKNGIYGLVQPYADLIIRNPNPKRTNMGFSKANNEAIIHALHWGSKYIACCNDDIEFLDSRWWQGIIDQFITYPEMFAVCPASPIEAGWGYGLGSDGKWVSGNSCPSWGIAIGENIWPKKPDGTAITYEECKTKEGYDILLAHRQGHIEGFAGWFVVFTREALEKVGLYDERFGPGCFLPDMKVLMSNFKYKKIRDINKNEEIISHTGKKNKVLNVVKKIYKGDIYEIKLVGTNEKIYVTPDHKVFCVLSRMQKDGRNYPWSTMKKIVVEKKVKELKNKDLLFFPKLNIVSKNLDLKKFGIKKRKAYKPDFIINETLFKIFGYYLAEGNLINKNYKEGKYCKGIMFTFNEKETEYAKEIVDYFNLYNINSTIYFKHICHSMRIEIYNAYIGRIFKELFGEYSYGKSIHPDILTCDNNLLKSLFLGYYNGDGCINHSFKKKSIKRYEQIQIKTVSYNLAKDIRTILYKLHIPSLLRTYKPSGLARRRGYEIYVSQTYFDEIFDSEKVKEKRRNEVFKEDEKIFYPIREIKKQQYKGYVYDLEIEKDHSYIINDISVHNSGEDYDMVHRIYIAGGRASATMRSFVFHWWGKSKEAFGQRPDIAPFTKRRFQDTNALFIHAPDGANSPIFPPRDNEKYGNKRKRINPGIFIEDPR